MRIGNKVNRKVTTSLEQDYNKVRTRLEQDYNKVRTRLEQDYNKVIKSTNENLQQG